VNTPVLDPMGNYCSLHLDISKHIEDICSEFITYDVKIYPPHSSTFMQAVQPTEVPMGSNGTFDLRLNTATSIHSLLRQNGLAYNDPNDPNEYYRVLWTVIDGCGNLTTCEDRIRLEDCKQPTPVCIHGLATVPMPSTGTITIWAKDFDASSFDNCTPEEELRYSFSGDVYEPSRLYTCEDILALGVEMAVEVWVWDNFNNRDYCSTTIVFTDPTGVCGFPMGGVNGLIVTPELNKAVTNVHVELIRNDEMFDDYTTTGNGEFIFPVVPVGHEYSLEAARGDNPVNGVTTSDLVHLQKHILSINPFTSPYQYIAADANNSENVSALDLIEIRKLILGIYTEFPKNKSWRFIPEAYQFQDPYHPWPFDETATFMVNGSLTENFVGVKIGDLNQSVIAHLGMILPRSDRSMTLSAIDKYIHEGEVVDVTFEVSDKTALWSGGQWELQLNGASIEEIIAVAPGMTEEMWVKTPTSVRMAWTANEPTACGPVFTIRLKAGKSGNLSDMINLDPSFLTPEIYNDDVDIFDLDITWRDLSEEVANEANQLHQNTPNPWNQETVIPFVLADAGIVSLQITDATGREMTRTERHFGAGKQQFKIHNDSWPDGLYYYTLRIGDTQLTKTMLILNKR
jgi:hypothetical protein